MTDQTARRSAIHEPSDSTFRRARQASACAPGETSTYSNACLYSRDKRSVFNLNHVQSPDKPFSSSVSAGGVRVVDNTL